jgi:hypothetical protein
MDSDLQKAYKIDKKHFEKFKKFFAYWIDIFGLKD